CRLPFPSLIPPPSCIHQEVEGVDARAFMSLTQDYPSGTLLMTASLHPGRGTAVQLEVGRTYWVVAGTTFQDLDQQFQPAVQVMLELLLTLGEGIGKLSMTILIYLLNN